MLGVGYSVHRCVWGEDGVCVCGVAMGEGGGTFNQVFFVLK